ncbi:hypothetical protein GCM10009817_02380 [Terrabacter lapilli]|uniref:LPXTG-motif cell wall-anchored protein n=1 Tax=Terrabacter lapilli TaxID=436231 RepID=A0ABN2RAA7_9MICO
MRATKASIAVLGLSAVLAGGVIAGATTATAANGNGNGNGHCKRDDDRRAYPPKECKLKLDHDKGHRGERFRFEGDGFKPGESAQGELHSTTVRTGTYVANAQGVISGSFVIPDNFPNGNHTFTLSGISSGVVKSASLTVTPAPAGGGGASSGSMTTGGTTTGGTTAGDGGGLAMTGANVAGIIGGGAALMLAGGALMVASRRRKHVNPAV